MKYLLDTNVISEPRKKAPEARVLRWLQENSQDKLFISVLTIGEIRKGVELLESQKKKAKINSWLEKDLLEIFEDRVVDIDSNITNAWGKIMAKYKNVPVVDGLLAASCIAYDFTLATRNVKDFATIVELKILNPWKD